LLTGKAPRIQRRNAARRNPWGKHAAIPSPAAIPTKERATTRRL
jgi:hypothetical protein